VAGWETADWESSIDSGVPRRDRRSGPYRRYRPDLLEAHPVTLDGELARRVAAAERAVRALNAPGAEALTSIARFLLRSEAIASSRIEGLAPSPQQVALAELGTQETVRGVSDQARLVANNMTVVRRATTELVEAEEVTVDHVVDLHRALLPDDVRHHGLRTVQNWIGGSDWQPIDADFVPPAPEHVLALMQDLVDYVNGAAHSPIVQAALVHAQFETIHPFTDGNGRVGRALIHTVLARRGVTSAAVLPVSLVLATLRHQYVEGLTAFRHDTDPAAPSAIAGIRTWLDVFTQAAQVAAEQSAELVDQVQELREEWDARVAAYRASQGLRETPRADSATARLLALLPEAAVATAGTLTRILGVSFPAAAAALDELHQAGVLNARKIERNATAYLATEVLDLITMTERRLASTKFDTRASDPVRAVPARPPGAPRED
jgi:Fic family protein